MVGRRTGLICSENHICDGEIVLMRNSTLIPKSNINKIKRKTKFWKGDNGNV